MRRRIIATVMAACALGVVLLFLPAARAVRDREHRAEVSDLQRDAMVVASRLPGDPLDADPAILADGAHRYGLYDGTGRLVAGRGPDPADDVVRRALTDIVVDGKLGEDLVAAVPLAAVDGVPGAVLRAEEPAAKSVGRIRASIARLGVVALVALAIAGVAGWLLVRRLVRPLETLRAVAQRIGDGDFTVETPVTGLNELDQLGDSLRSSAVRIDRLLTRERAFSSDASHQLRTPLAALRTTLETELYAPREDPRLAVRESLAAVDRLERTVSTLLGLARDEPPDRAPLDAALRLKAAAERWAGAAATAARHVEVDVEPGAPTTAHASSAAVDHILDVLVENALQHGRGDVVLAIGRRHGVTGIEVRDAGEVAADADERLFRRRESLSGSTGIGLHLARALAEAEGGRLRLARHAPTTFELLLRSNEHPPRTTASPGASPRGGQLSA